MFHLAAYTTAIGNTADTDVPALQDDIIAIQNTHFILSQPYQLLGAMVMSATLSRAKISSPTLRQVAPPFVRPINVAALPAANPNMMLLDQSNTRLQSNEEIQLLATSGVAMTERLYGLIWITDGITPPPIGQVTPLRWTSTTAAVAVTWTTLSITFADTIPTGRYAMLLSEHQSTGPAAHRWIVSNQYLRPGFPSFASLGSRLPYALSKYQWGVMGYFNSNDLPRLQVLCTSTDNAHEGYLHVVRVGDIYSGR